MPAPMMVTSWPTVISSSLPHTSFFVRWVMLQKRNKMQPAESSADMVFTIRATCDGSLTNCENRLAVSMKNGAPGGWPTSSL